jgi:hypothetical protein
MVSGIGARSADGGTIASPSPYITADNLPATDPLELGPHPRDLLDQSRSDLDHPIELAGHDPCQRERLGTELTPAARA